MACPVRSVCRQDIRALVSGLVLLYCLAAPNPAAAQTSIACGQTHLGTIGPSEQDIYTFTANANEAVIIAAVTTSGALQANARLFDPNGAIVPGGNTGINGATQSLRLPLTGTYTILVQDYSRTKSGAYNASLTFTTGRCAKRIACGQTISDSTGVPAEHDTYSFSGTAGDAVVISAVTTSGGLQANARLFDPSGVIVPGGDTGINGATQSLVLPSAGAYTIVTRDYSLTRSGGHNVSLTFTTGQCAKSIGCGQTSGGAVTGSAQSDTYSFAGTAGDAVVIAAVTTSGGLQANAMLFDPNGVIVPGGNTGINSATQSLVLRVAGTYTIKVQDYSLTRGGTYDVNLSFTTGRCGRGIASGTPVAGTVSAVGEADAFVFCGVKNSHVVVAAVASSGLLQANALVFGPNGVQVPGGNSGINGATGSLALPLDGNYTILVRDYSLQRQGNYNLSIAVIGATCPLAAPIILSHPVSRGVHLRHAAQFSVAASGIPAPTYTWHVSTDGGASWTALTDGPPFSGTSTETLTVTDVGLALNRAQFRAVATNGVSSAVSHAATLKVLTVHDFDSDGLADLTVYRPGTGEWYARQSTSGYGRDHLWFQWGAPGDVPIVGDFDGDRRADLVVWRPSEGMWYIRYSQSNYEHWAAYQWGVPGDEPLAADFDGDGQNDLVVFRPQTGQWFIRFSSSGYGTGATYQWGLPGDVPIAGDFDGDGKGDLVVWRPAEGTWYIRFTTSQDGSPNVLARQWGIAGDVPLSADFDGDGKKDLAVWRPAEGNWYILFSTTQYSYTNWIVHQWGGPGDIPVATDFDGDGQTELAVYRPSIGTWFVMYSSSDYSHSTWRLFQWGVAGDIPLGDVR